ncbi:MAG TPA: hypothetical protein HPP83_12895 [Candidatus Hydrogenedentes bacterium]|nr:hypothetical protein [Candidatus Hydrogenedentota bacterium]
MVRIEFLIVGLVLVAVGVGLCILGYNELQPTTGDKAVGFLEELTGEPAPSELKSPKGRAYAFLACGALAFVGGLGLILCSRSRTNPIREEQG